MYTPGASGMPPFIRGCTPLTAVDTILMAVDAGAQWAMP